MKEIEYDYLQRYLKFGEENVIDFCSGYIWLTNNFSPAFNYVFYVPTFDTIYSVFNKLPCFKRDISTFEFYLVYYQEVKRKFHHREINRFIKNKMNISLIELCEILLSEDDIIFANGDYEFYTYIENGKKQVCFSKAYDTRQELYNEFIKHEI